MPAWLIPAITAAAGLIGQGIAKGKDERQIRQQGKLNNLQINAQDEMNKRNMATQMEMWEKTNYDAQKLQMKKAGLNPAMMYGMSGGGGVTIGNASGSIAGGQAPSGSGQEAESFTSMGLALASQVGLQDAQRKNIEADTQLKEVEATKTAGVDTKLATTQIANLEAGITNTNAITLLTKAKEKMQNLETELAGRTMEDKIETVNYEAKRACQLAQQAVNDTDVSDATIKDKIKIIKLDAIQKLLDNTLTKAQTRNIKTDTKLKEAQTYNVKQGTTQSIAQTANIEQGTRVQSATVQKIFNDIEQGWGKISNEQQRMQLEKILKEEGYDIQRTDQIIRGVIGVASLGRAGHVTNIIETP